jgi:transcriptional regulator with XRE-family HTH domain
MFYPFGTRLKELRTMRGLDRAQLADLVGVTPAAISHYENGLRGVSVPQAARLAKALGVTLNELVPLDKQGNFVEPQATPREYA